MSPNTQILFSFHNLKCLLELVCWNQYRGLDLKFLLICNNSSSLVFKCHLLKKQWPLCYVTSHVLNLAVCILLMSFNMFHFLLLYKLEVSSRGLGRVSSIFYWEYFIDSVLYFLGVFCITWEACSLWLSHF